ncbi:MAG: acyl-CoA dehydrogenase family protein [Aeromicrobium sp.]
MDFALSDEQRLIRDTFEEFCSSELHYEYVRWMDENLDFPPDELWDKVVDLGLFSASVPEQ